MMKRLLLLLLAASVLTGCADSGTDKSENDPAETSAQYIAINRDYYQNGIVYYNDSARTAMYLDIESMEEVPLCARPNCNHKDSSCLARQVGDVPVFYNGYIYFFQSNNGAVRETPDGEEFYIDSKLMRASLDTSEVEKVCGFELCPVMSRGSYVLDGSELYFVCDDLNPDINEYGVGGWGNSGGVHSICSIDLDTGEFTDYGSIYDGDKGYAGAEYSSCAGISGVYGGKMYLRYSFIKDIDSMQNGGNFDELYEHLNFEFDLETKRWKEAELPISWYMNDDTYVYYDKESKNVNVIYKGSELSFPCENEADSREAAELNGKLFMYNIGKWYDLSDMSEHSLGEYKGYGVTAAAYHDGEYIFIKNYRPVRLTEEELLALDN